MLLKVEMVNDKDLDSCSLEVERVLNKNPPIPMPSDAKDQRLLTPNSLLLLGNGNSNKGGGTEGN